ncbi:MAG TPA: tetratricopeptide repeat protein [Planctomycetota bacterium]|nr:tetratricopeptide repeat protein [Planctomycetota bacterium]
MTRASARRLGTVLATLFAAPAARGVQDVPNWARDVAPLVFRECASCHRPGEAAPFSLLDGEEAARHARQIARVVAARRMPPWLAEPSDPPFVGTRRLTDEQIALLARWAEAGAPLGDPAAAPAAPVFASGWQLGKPDLVVEMPQEYVLAPGGSDTYRNFVIPVALEASRYVHAVEIHPRNLAITHHGVLKRDRSDSSRRMDARDAAVGFDEMDAGLAASPDGQFLGWTPGRTPRALSEGMAWRLAPGDDLVLQLHLLPSGKEERVGASIGLYFTDERPTKVPCLIHMGSRSIDIPAGARDYEVRDQYVLPIAAELHSLLPHAHFLGKSVEVWAVLPEGRRRTLLTIPRWDFSWQDEYRFSTPIALPAGTLLAYRFTFDNSDENPRNPHRPATRVRWGASSLAEMCDVWAQVLPGGGDDFLKLMRDVAAHESDMYRRGFEADVAYSPLDAQARLGLGVVLLGQGEAARAVAELRKAVTLAPMDAPIWFQLGRALAPTDPDAARAAYEVALHLEADEANALAGLGALDEAAKKDTEARTHYEQAVAARPSTFVAQAGLGRLLAAAGEWDAAAAHLVVALDVDSTSTTLRKLLVDVEKRRGAYASAVAHLKKLLWFGVDLEAQRDLAWLLATAPEDAARDGKQAIELARALLDLGPDDPRALDVLAAAQAEARRFKAAVETAERAKARAEAAGDADLAHAIEARLARYREGAPWREAAPAK